MAYPEWLASTMSSDPMAPGHHHVGTFLLALADLEEARRTRPTCEAALASELAYDRALLNLSLQLGIETGPERFEVPERERERLHRALAEALPALREVMSDAGLLDEC